MRRVADPNGGTWSVDVSWTDLQFWSMLTRKRRQRAQKRNSDAPASPHESEETGGPDVLDVAGQLLPDDFPGIFAVIAVVVVVIVAVIAFPWLLVLFLDLAELLVFPLLALGIIGWRVARRRPFTITAERGNEVVAEWNVIGAREARRVERAVADAIVAGGEPAELFPEYAPRH
jgi:hypothetical protein